MKAARLHALRLNMFKRLKLNFKCTVIDIIATTMINKAAVFDILLLNHWTF